jgi:hypothetical protein
VDSTENNLLLNLHKLAPRQDENFHTEVLAHLLRHLLQYEPEAAANALRAITGNRVDLKPQNVAQVKISTQVTTSKGRPDIAIKTSTHLIYVEVKVESGLGDLQLERYRAALKESGFEFTHLALLTRYPFIPTNGGEEPDTIIRWHQIADWLTSELERKTIHQASSIFLIEQFLGFLEERGMTLEQVSKELMGEQFIQGIQSLRNLLTMVEETLISARVVTYSFEAEWDYMGYYFTPFPNRPDKYWIGINYDEPHILTVNTEDEIDEEIYNKLGKGYIDERYWVYELDLSSKEVDFFVLTKLKQLECIETFLRDSLNVIKDITV